MKVMPFPFRTFNVQQILQLHPESSHAIKHHRETNREGERKKEKCWFTFLLRIFHPLQGAPRVYYYLNSHVALLSYISLRGENNTIILM